MSQWVAQKERGALWTMRFMLWLCRQRYRWPVNALLYPIAAYFLLTGRSARRASRHFFLLATGRHSWLDSYRQLLCFSRSLVDRVVVLMGDTARFQVRPQGREALYESVGKGQGAIMLGSHLGNFEALKMLARDVMAIEVHIVAYFAGSQKIRQALDSINPDLNLNIIDPTDPDAVFRMRDVIEKGGILAILGDRTGIGEKQLPVEFMGETTWLPAGPYYLASILGCPVFCFFGVRVDDYLYDTYIIKLAGRIELVRGRREQEAQAYAQQYADLLAEKARAYPCNWFNFYEFWQNAGDAGEAAARTP
jgi:predicted LPLAT superfamily acyltransferase